jgi:hypothetical protein
MLSTRKIIQYGGLASVLCFAALTTESLLAQNASPAGSPPAAAAASPAVQAATPAPTPIPPDPTGTANNAGTGIDLAWPAPAKADPKTSLSTGEPTIDDAAKTTVGANSELVKNVAHNKISINVVWTLITGFLVMFMQAGFALVETGLCRAKSAAHVMSTNFMIYGLGMLGFWICGFAIMFGGVGVAPGAIGAQPTLGQGISLLNKEISIPIFGKPFGGQEELVSSWGIMSSILPSSLYFSSKWCSWMPPQRFQQVRWRSAGISETSSSTAFGLECSPTRSSETGCGEEAGYPSLE